MHEDKLTVRTPEEQEAHDLDILNDPDTVDTLNALDPSIIARLAKLEALEREAADSKAKLRKAQEALIQRNLRESQSPLNISTKATDVHPDYIDIAIGATPSALIQHLTSILERFVESEDLTKPFGFDMALIPVPLYPVPAIPANRPNVTIGDLTSPNYEIGRTNVRNSRACTTVLLRGHKRQVSLSAMAIVNINPIDGLTPHAILERIERSHSNPNFARLNAGNPLYGDHHTHNIVAHDPRHPGACDTDTDHEGDDRIAPPFTPSAQKTQRPTSSPSPQEPTTL